MSYRRYPASNALLIGYDPERDLPKEHLARLVEQAVEEGVELPSKAKGKGQPEFDPRLCLKVLIYGYATGVRSSRQLERQCRESLPYLYLTRGDTPSYRTLCTVRRKYGELMETVWVGMFVVAERVGLKRMGRIVVDSSKLRANASSESVVRSREYEAVQQELRRILQEAEVVDAQEEREGYEGETRLSQTPDRALMRDILRRVRRQLSRAQGQGGKKEEEEEKEEDEQEEESEEPKTPVPVTKISSKMRERVATGLEAIAQAESEGRKQVSLTDPDAAMMPEGCEKKIRECHSFEIAVEKDSGLIIAGQSSQHGNDNHRLEGLVAAAQSHEPTGVVAVDADSGYFSGDAVGRLIEAGIDTCIPDSNTAGDLHRGWPIGTVRGKSAGGVAFTYEAQADVYRCPQGNVLSPRQQRREAGQDVTVYRAQASCQGCPRGADCLVKPQARQRTIKVGRYQPLISQALQRFTDRAHQERYHHRGCVVETVFGFLRSVLGYGRWFLRGAKGVACEAILFKTAYQIRKLHTVWSVLQ
jgi:transposase